MKTEREYSAPFKSFILALQRWIDLDFPKTGPFVTHHSLCLQVRPYAGVGSEFASIRDSLWVALFDTTESTCLPFNSDWPDYESERADYYKNPARLAWVKMMADTFKAEEETK